MLYFRVWAGVRVFSQVIQPAFEAAVLVVAYMAEAKTTDYAQAAEAIEQASRESLTLGLKKIEQRRLYIKARVIDLAKENNNEQAWWTVCWSVGKT